MFGEWQEIKVDIGDWWGRGGFHQQSPSITHNLVNPPPLPAVNPLIGLENGRKSMLM
jgi:hypothetical protein